MSITATMSERERSWALIAKRAWHWFSRHWLMIINALIGLYVGLPWLAPVLMKLGMPWSTLAGKAIYLIYSTQCHQLPERSYFLFGPKAMYSLAEVQAAWVNTSNPVVLRQFIGNEAMGWKVAWSDRMVSMYTGILVTGLLFALVRRWLKPLSGWGFVAFILPMAIDGGTHLISDIAGIGNGFRDSNAWLAALTGNLFPAAFYTGDALGSFNSWMRLLTGSLFAIGSVWLAYPYLESEFAVAAAQIQGKFQKAGLIL